MRKFFHVTGSRFLQSFKSVFHSDKNYRRIFFMKFNKIISVVFKIFHAYKNYACTFFNRLWNIRMSVLIFANERNKKSIFFNQAAVCLNGLYAKRTVSKNMHAINGFKYFFQRQKRIIFVHFFSSPRARFLQFQLFSCPNHFLQ